MDGKTRKSHDEIVEFERYQSLLFPFAYNITGDYLASEDIVQEVLNNHLLTKNPEIQNPRHYLIRSVINRAINEKQLLRTRMEQYPGRWLPTPMITAEAIYQAADRDHIIRYSLLVLMEQLNPKERAVFILKETFDFSHEEIADVLKIKPDHSRQLLKRSKEKIQEPEHAATLDNNSKNLLSALANAILTADLDKAKSLLANDIQCISDGGPTISASRNVLTGPEHVSKLLKAIYGKYFLPGTKTEYCEINHSPSIVFSLDGRVYRCIVLQIVDGIITNVFIILNPEKLGKLGVLSRPHPDFCLRYK